MEKLISFARPFIFQPLRLGRANPLHQRSKFFLSFGDAFLFLLKHCQIADKKETALVPGYYCPETLKVIARHFKLSFYEINNDFSLNKESYFSQLEKFKPRLLINYCFTGFSLSPEEKNRLAGLMSEQMIIIEDYAHRLIDFSDWQPLNKNHFIIDSIRKNSPFLGSHLIGGDFVRTQAANFNWYKLKCQLFQLLKDFLISGAVLFNSSWLYDLSEKTFFAQNEIIGNYFEPTKGDLLSFAAYNFLNTSKLKKHCHRLSLAYQAELKRLSSPLIRILSDQAMANSELAYYPIFVDQEVQADLAEYLRSRKIYVERLWDQDNEFNNQPDSGLYQSFLIIPLTYVLTEADAKRAAKEINNFIKK